MGSEVGIGCRAKHVRYQSRNAMADIACNGVQRQNFPLHLLKHEIRRIHQVELGIDQRAVQIEEKRADGVKFCLAHICSL